MPSGAKKRKAGKRKKEKLRGPNDSNINDSSMDSNLPQGNDDPKSQDEHGSSLSQDQHNDQHPFNEGNRESDISGSSLVHSFVAQSKLIEGVSGDAEGCQNVRLEDETVVKIERELNSESGVESKDIYIEQVESAKESHDADGRSSSSGSSESSDDEPRSFEKKQEEEALSSVLNATSDNAKKALDSFSEELTKFSENEKLFKEANGNSVVGIVPNDDLVAPVALIDVVKHGMEGSQVENSEILDVVEPGLKEDEHKLLPKYDDAYGVSLAVSVPRKYGDRVFPLLDENVGASSNVVGSTINGNEDKPLTSLGDRATDAKISKDCDTASGTVNGNEAKLLTSSGAPTAKTRDDVEIAKDPETSECIENKPLIASAPRLAQRTSWISCCGLFDVLTGSNR